MSIEIMNAVWRHSKSTGRARLVLLAIADHQGELGAWPSNATLAQMTNSSERSIRRDIQELVDLGELRVEYQNAPTRGQYKTNLYWVTLPGVTNPSGGSDFASGGSELSSGGSNEDIRGVTVGLQNLNLTITEPLREPRATKLPQDWIPNENLIGMFRDKWPLIAKDKDYHIEQFKLYWIGTGKPMKDWGLTFQRWMNQEEKKAASRSKKKTDEFDWAEWERKVKEEEGLY